MKKVTRLVDSSGVFFIGLIVIFLVVGWRLKLVIAGSHYFLYLDQTLDFYSAYYQYYGYIVSKVLSGDFANFDLSIGLGQTTSIFGGGFIFDPFNLILMLGGAQHFHLMLWVAFILKLWVSFIFFSLYLEKLGISRKSATIGGLLYVFSAYSLGTGQQFMFATAISFYAVILWAFESFLQNNKMKSLLISVGLLFCFSFYFSYLFFAFFIPFSIVRILVLKRDLGIKKGLGAILVLFYGIGAATILTFPVWFPALRTTLSSPRIGGLSNFVQSVFQQSSTKLIYNFLSSFYTDEFLYSANSYWYRGINDFYNDPKPSLGILVVLFLIPAIWTVIKTKRVELFATLIFLPVLPITTMFPMASAYFNGFSTVSHRWGYLFSILLIPLVSYYFDVMTANSRETRIRNASLCIALAILAGALVKSHFLSQITFDEKVVTDICAYILLLLLAAVVVHSLLKKSLRDYVYPALLLILILDCSYFSSRRLSEGRHFLSESSLESIKSESFSKVQALTSYTGMNGLTRVEFEDPLFVNGSLLNGSWGMKSYLSVQNRDLVNLYKKLGVYLLSNNVIHFPPLARPNTLAILGVGSYISNWEDSGANRIGNSFEIKHIDKASFAYFKDSVISEDQVSESLTKPQVEEALIKNLVVPRGLVGVEYNNHWLPMVANAKSDGYIEFVNTDCRLIGSDKEYVFKHANKACYGFLNFSKGAPKHFVLRFKSLDSGFVQVYTAPRPRDYAFGFDAIHNIYRTFFYDVPIGESEFTISRRSDAKSLEIKLEDFDERFSFTIEPIDFPDYTAELKPLRTSKLNDHLIFEGVAENDKWVLLGLPYSSQWKIFLNGTETNYLKAQFGFIGVPVKSGDVKIEAYYKSESIALMASFVLIGATMLLILLYLKKRVL